MYKKIEKLYVLDSQIMNTLLPSSLKIITGMTSSNIIEVIINSVTQFVVSER